MATYKTPGVYVEEISILPPSVAEVETAIPAFIGFTQTGARYVPRRIASLVEYEEIFGTAEAEKNISVLVETPANGLPSANGNGHVGGGAGGAATMVLAVKTSAQPQVLDRKVTGASIAPATKSRNVMFYAMQLYFGNGGGPCYVVPAGNFADSQNDPRDAYGKALLASSTEDEPTLLVFPDAPLVLGPEGADDYYSLMNDALRECARLGDRFTIIDVLEVDGGMRPSVARFRQAISGNLGELKYGAAYYPSLNTSLNHTYNEDDVTVTLAGDSTAGIRATEAQARLETLQNELKIANDEVSRLDKEAKAARKEADRLKPAAGASDPEKAAFKEADDAAKDLEARLKTAQDRIRPLTTVLQTAQTQAERTAGAVRTEPFGQQTNLLKNQIKKIVGSLGVQLPASAAVAGVYANVDATRGVWKAPANVTLNYVTSTTVKITDDDQKDLNVDVNDGKSVNAIRAFIGKGTKIWGARTLAGNDNEWRYVNVRRFFNMVEESVKKSTYWAVFEPNEINTWTRVRSMIENYLLLKWKDGALAGTKPDEAFFVRVGLGQTMSPQDVLEGRMVIEIGMAAVRPAEFIILKFSHKLQNA
jgi:hypothetical protein